MATSSARDGCQASSRRTIAVGVCRHQKSLTRKSLRYSPPPIRQMAHLRPGLLGYTGGGVEDGETFEQAAIREQEEETGTRLE
jgi:8-oxo-dGTP pyrophosphatase MutT (NUDIX family)